MKKRKGEIDGFWLFMICLFIVLPIVKLFTGNNDNDGEKGSKPKIVNSKGSVLEIDHNSTVAAVNTQVKFVIKKEVLIVKKTSPDNEDPEVITIRGKYAITSFDKVGRWSIDMYNVNDILVDWIIVTVY